MASVNWTARAQQALDNIYSYISLDAPIYAERFVQQLITAADRLEDFPLSGRMVPEAEQDDIREIIYQHYRIIYWIVNPQRIDIITVIHASRDLSDPENQAWQVH